jgi:toxin ParE1/3/4
MSVPRRRLILTPRAQAHLRAIRRYTVRQWGPQQYATCRAKLTASMERLTEFPALGTDASHIAPGVHAFPVEQHVIYYRFSDEAVHVVGILHSRMDAAAQLER